MLDDIVEAVTDSSVTYLAVAGFVALDAVFPIAPSETLLAATGALAAEGRLSLPLLDLAGVLGALSGHSVLYLLGRQVGPLLRRRMFRSELAQTRLRRTEMLLHDRTWLLIVSDFLPGGRTAAMFAAGALALPARRFYAFVVPGAMLWATFYVLLGYAGGSAFEGGWPALVASVAAALGVAGAAEVFYRLRR